jgi:isopentenyl phosphate kinase
MLTLLKLGGSLITDKTRPHTPRLDQLDRLAGEIASVMAQQPHLRLVLGHGSGSFGHAAASRYGTRHGTAGPEQWRGFVEVWREAQALNRLVMDALAQAHLPAIAFPPSAGVTAQDGRLLHWDIAPIQAALEAGLLPVVYGDVIFDTRRGGVILSTEDLFEYLAAQLLPERVLLAGLEAGVWQDYPTCARLYPRLTPGDVPAAEGLAGSAAVDVTGGMRSKVLQSLALVQTVPGLTVRIFSGLQAGALRTALLGGEIGTLITTQGATGATEG